MEPKMRHSASNTKPSPRVPHKGKRELTSSRGPKRLGFMLQCIGFALVLACPYLYHALMVWCAGTVVEALFLVSAPVAIFFLAAIIYNKGDNMYED